MDTLMYLRDGKQHIQATQLLGGELVDRLALTHCPQASDEDTVDFIIPNQFIVM